MDAIFSSEQEKASPSKQPAEDQNDSKQENRERKFRFRHLTEEMLEISRRISEEQDLYQRQYEEAAFKVYETLPARKNFLSGRSTKGIRKQG